MVLLWLNVASLAPTTDDLTKSPPLQVSVQTVFPVCVTASSYIRMTEALALSSLYDRDDFFSKVELPLGLYVY